jgi:hypothetical protein
MITSCKKWMNLAQNMPSVSAMDFAKSQPRNPAMSEPRMLPRTPKNVGFQRSMQKRYK